MATGAELEQEAAPETAPARRLAGGYVVLAAFLAGSSAAALGLSARVDAAPDVAGAYAVEPARCLGPRVEIEQSGQFLALSGGGAAELRLRDGRVAGDAACPDGSRAEVSLAPAAGGRLEGTVGGDRVVLSPAAGRAGEEAGQAGEGGHLSGEEVVGRLMLAIAVVILAARLLGAALGALGQPRVMGEVLAGIALGPTLVGAVWPAFQDYVFPPDVVPLLFGAAQLGLVFYLFLLGMELDVDVVRRQLARAVFISNASIAVPFALGLLLSVVLYELLAPNVDYLPFALFIGVALSITAFPVLARILVERRMLRRPVGAIAIAGAAIDDVTAWGLLALATAVAGTGSGLDALGVVALAGAFTAGMLLVARPALGRVSVAYDEAGHVPAVWMGAIVVAVLVAAYTAQEIGVAAVFGAFVTGLVMPRHAGLTRDVSRRLEEFVVVVLLPLFFVVTGLRTDVGALDRPLLWLLGLAVLAVAVAGKVVGAAAAARLSGMPRRESLVVGALMNTRGLTELIVLNIGLELGIISTALFTMLVLVALVTTFAAGPALRLLDPRGELGEPPEDELDRFAPEREALRSILVAPLDDSATEPLLAVAEPLARSEPPRELLLVHLLQPASLAPGLSREAREVAEAAADLNARRALLEARGVAARAAAFTSPDVGSDLVRLAARESVDLLLVNGRRPLLGPGVPGGETGRALADAPCDVAVLVDREGDVRPGPDRPVVVPFGGAPHDWTALELGAWLAAAHGAPLRLLGAAARDERGRDASRLLAEASLVVQQLAGVAAEPSLVRPGEVVAAAAGSGLLVVGLAERWREEGLGPVRAELLRAAPAPTLLVRRGRRPGALTPDRDLTRHRWSATGHTTVGG